jgi:hypothetical protein
MTHIAVSKGIGGDLPRRRVIKNKFVSVKLVFRVNQRHRKAVHLPSALTADLVVSFNAVLLAKMSEQYDVFTKRISATHEREQFR